MKGQCDQVGRSEPNVSALSDKEIASLRESAEKLFIKAINNDPSGTFAVYSDGPLDGIGFKPSFDKVGAYHGLGEVLYRKGESGEWLLL